MFHLLFVKSVYIYMHLLMIDPEMRRDGKANVFLASRLQLTPSSDWEQHSLSNFAYGYKRRRGKF